MNRLAFTLSLECLCMNCSVLRLILYKDSFTIKLLAHKGDRIGWQKK